MTKTQKIVLSVAGAVLVLAVAWWLWSAKQRITPPELPEPTSDVGADISAGATGNPADALPQTNPFETKTNPFDGAYQNPFGE